MASPLCFHCCTAGALCAIGLGQHIQDTQAALLGSRWPTAKAGVTYVALLAVFVLGPGLMTLWVSLLLLKLQRHAERSSSSSCGTMHAQGAKCASAAAMDAASSGSVPKTAVGAVAAAAVAAARCSSSGRLLATADVSLQLQLPTLPKQPAMFAGSTASSATQEAAQLGVLQSSGAALCLPVERGRPTLQRLVKGWLATQQQLSMHEHSGKKRCYAVYGMGPQQLVCQVQQLCDEDAARLCFVQKTHQL